MGSSSKKDKRHSGAGADKQQPESGASRGGDGDGLRFGRFVVIKAVLVFGLVMGAYYFVEQRYLLDAKTQDRILGPYLELIARSVAGLLNLVGHASEAEGRFVGLAMFKVEIVHGCDALEPSFAFIAAVLASPVGLWRKIPGLFVGAFALLLINVGRIASLFLLGAYYPKALDVMHYDVWQAVFIVLAVILWAIWVHWATKSRKAGKATSDGQGDG